MRYNAYMSIKYDLHTHSTASDGTFSPTELVRHVAATDVGAFALTDHDTTSGIDEAAQSAQQFGMRLVPGVEISVSWHSHVIHILGLSIDPACDNLQQGLAAIRRFRSWRAEEMGCRLEKKGIAGAFEGARILSNGRLISRTHFGRFLVQKGYVKDMREAFQKYLKPGKPGYVSGRWAELEDTITWIVQAGGLAVIAHPARYPLTRTKLRQLLGEFVEAGGTGLEVVSGSHSHDDNFKMGRHAIDFGLFASMGSDYHGPENAWADIGQLPALPDGCEPIWRNWERDHSISA